MTETPNGLVQGKVTNSLATRNDSVVIMEKANTTCMTKDRLMEGMDRGVLRNDILSYRQY